MFKLKWRCFFFFVLLTVKLKMKFVLFKYFRCRFSFWFHNLDCEWDWWKNSENYLKQIQFGIYMSPIAFVCSTIIQLYSHFRSWFHFKDWIITKKRVMCFYHINQFQWKLIFSIDFAAPTNLKFFQRQRKRHGSVRVHWISNQF